MVLQFKVSKRFIQFSLDLRNLKAYTTFVCFEVPDWIHKNIEQSDIINFIFPYFPSFISLKLPVLIVER